jgi:hypothetical protein
MTDYRDPQRPDYRDRSMDQQAWSTATWGWIAGIAIVVLVLIFAFGIGGNGDRTATDTKNPPATTGQRTPAAPPAGASSDAPTQSRPTPAPGTTPPK